MRLDRVAKLQEYEEGLQLTAPVLGLGFAGMSATIGEMRVATADACAAIDRALAGEPK